MNLRSLALGAVSALALAGAGNAATLTGQTVDVTLTANGINFGTQTVLVGAGNDGNYFGNTFFDLDGGVNGDQFIYTSTGDFCGINCGGQVVWTLSGLNFGGPFSFSILQQDIAPITVESLTATSVSFSYADLSITTGVEVIGQFGSGSTGAIPEPATWAMMILGFGAAGSMIRRRKVAVA